MTHNNNAMNCSKGEKIRFFCCAISCARRCIVNEQWSGTEGLTTEACNILYHYFSLHVLLFTAPS